MKKIAMKSYKYRLYPTKEQEDILRETLTLCRELYNAALDEWRSAAPRFLSYKSFGTVAFVMVHENDEYPKDAPKEKQVGIVYTDMKSCAMRSVTLKSQSRQLTEIKRELRPEYKKINDHILRDVLRRIDKARQAFFRRMDKGEKPGYPRFKKANRYHSFTTDSGFKIKERAVSNPRHGCVYIQNIGWMKMTLHRPVEGKVKTCTVKREVDQWFVVFSCEVESVARPGDKNEVVGVDVGLNRFAAFSTGEQDGIDNPRYYRTSAPLLARRQQSVARKKKNSRRQAKARKLVAKTHRKIARQRKDFLHQESRKLVDTYETIALEDLQIKNMVRSPKPKYDEDGTYLPNGAASKGGLNKSILDAGWGMFRQFCLYKAEEAGRAVILVNPRNTSQICSRCGAVVAKPLSQRVHTCPHCGAVLDRDYNGALNIRILALKEIEARRACSAEQDASQSVKLAGSAFRPSEMLSPKGKKSRRSTEKLSLSPSPSQATLWDGP